MGKSFTDYLEWIPGLEAMQLTPCKGPHWGTHCVGTHVEEVLRGQNDEVRMGDPKSWFAEMAH
jgi:hypothetical protein